MERLLSEQLLIYANFYEEIFRLLEDAASPAQQRVRRASAALKNCFSAVARAAEWEPLKHLAYGTLFETKVGKRFVTTDDRSTWGIICYPLSDGQRTALVADTLVRRLTIKEG